MAERGPLLSAAAASDLRPAIRAEAFAQGFVLCGFAAVQPIPHREFVSAWLAAGKAGSMEYLEKGFARRLDPGQILPGVRTLITLAYPYAPPPPEPLDWRAELRGRIAGYAAGLDYHHVVRQKLDAVAHAIQRRIPAARALTYVDTGAILEREWATLGGVGWFGKNTMVLHRVHGSWFFLGEILIDLELEPDPPVADHCGTCRRCLDDCPTGALEGNYGLDARLCISYLTIELRGAIPRELRPRMANWVFGCDVCQDVCPWNARAEPSDRRREILLPYLPDLLALDPEGFRARYRQTALWRTGREGMARNAAVALGNSGNPDAVGPLARALRQDPSPLVRGHAAWALGTLGGAAARAELERARRDIDAAVRAEAEAGL